MKLIVGLGNPGAEYARSRHNIGWMIADAFAAKFRIDIDKHEKEALTGRGRVGGGAVVVARPLTYMNRSGEAVKLLTDAYLESLQDLLVVHDEIDLPLEKLRLRERGSPGTHNGMRSVVESLATESFPRLRFGVRGANYAEDGRLRDYVLDDFEENELPIVHRTIERAVDALVLFARGELKRAMNEFNRDPDDSESESDSDSPEKP
ncbi:MAG TPA: aminoacyl-tRNA hydrolase [Thermoanaerobaculia bacterium]